MAHGLETRRQDVRLEKFLRGQFSQEVYERVSSSEPCVLISPDEKRVHRYAVLGHTQLYTTEFPPKKLKTLLKLEDIISISMVRLRMRQSFQNSLYVFFFFPQLTDLPDFLSGEEQQNTVHVQICYKRDLPTNRDRKFLGSLGNKKRKPQKDREGEFSQNQNRALSPNGPTPLVLERGAGLGPASAELSPLLTGRRSPRLVLPSALNLVGSSSSGVEGRGQQQVSHKSALNLVKSSSSGIEGRRLQQQVSHKSPVGARRSPGLAFATRSNLEITRHEMDRAELMGASAGYDDDESPLEQRCTSLQEFPLPTSSKFGGSQSSRHLTLPPLERNQMSIMKQLKSAGSMKHLTVPPVASLAGQLSQKNRTTSQPELSKDKATSSVLKDGGMNDLRPYMSSSFETLSFLQPLSPHLYSSGGSLSSVGSGLSLNSYGDGEVVQPEQVTTGAEVATVDLYILKQTTDFYHQLKVLWDNARIVSQHTDTLQYNLKYNLNYP